MNLARVKMLAGQGNVEATRKVLKRFSQMDLRLSEIAASMQTAAVQAEDVFSVPDFTFQLRTEKIGDIGDLVCVQTGDGRSVRIVGAIIPVKRTSKAKA
jgi:hypothetical protein